MAATPTTKPIRTTLMNIRLLGGESIRSPADKPPPPKARPRAAHWGPEGEEPDPCCPGLLGRGMAAVWGASADDSCALGPAKVGAMAAVDRALRWHPYLRTHSDSPWTNIRGVASGAGN